MFRNKKVLIFVTLCLCWLISNTALANTIVLKSGNAAIGHNDPNITVYGDNQSLEQAWVVGQVSGAWGTALPGTQWISPASNGSSPGGDFWWEIDFALPQAVSNLSLSVSWMSDNTGYSVLLNGNEILSPAGMTTPSTYVINDPTLFLPGNNSLIFYNNENQGSHGGIDFLANVSYGPTPSTLAGIANDGSIWYSQDLATWNNIPGQLKTLAIADLNNDGSSDIAGLANDGSIWYTLDLMSWTNIPGTLSQLSAGTGRVAGIAADQSIWYSTNGLTWNNILGALSSLLMADFTGSGTYTIAGLAADHSIWYTTDMTTWNNIPGRLTSLVSGDFDGVGHSQLAGLAADNSIWWTYDMQTWINVPGSLTSMAVADLYGEGYADMVGIASDGTMWYSIDLENWTNIPTPSTLSNLIVGDFDGNGLDDLAALDAQGNILYTTDLQTWQPIPGTLSSIYSTGSILK